MEYTNLVIEGGGSKAYSTIGCIKAFEEMGRLGDFKNLIGTSAGSVLAMLIAIGCSSSEMKSYYDTVDLSLFNINYSSFRTYFNIIFNNGVHNPSKLEKLAHDILEDKTGNGDITFKQIYEKYEKFLVITGTCLNKRTTHYYHHESNPNMKVKTAIKISCCVPIIFSPVKWKGDILCDGGLLENYPLYFFNNDECPNSKIHNVSDKNENISHRTIGIKYTDNSTSEKKLYTGNDKITGIGSYLKSIFRTFITGIERKGIKDKYWERTIAVNIGDFVSVTELILTDEQKETLSEVGYKSTIEFFKIKNIKYFNINIK